MWLEPILSRGRRLLAHVRRTEIGFAAAAIAYYWFVSLIPVAVIVFTVVQQFQRQVLVEWLLAVSNDVFSDTGRRFVQTTLENSQGAVGVTLSGIAAFLWSSIRMFRGVDAAFARVYDYSESTSLLGQFRDAVLVIPTTFIAIAFVLAIGAGATSVLAPYPGFVDVAVLLVGLSVVFLPSYYILPSISARPRAVVPGAVVTATCWTVLYTLFQLYVGYGGYSVVYGVLGGLVLFVTWLYLGAFTLLFGGVVNAVVAGVDR